MKFLISSKYLAKKLSEIDFETETVLTVSSTYEDVVLRTNKKNVKIEVETDELSNLLKQDCRRWDWVKNNVSKVNEQPLFVEITEKRIDLTYSY